MTVPDALIFIAILIAGGFIGVYLMWLAFIVAFDRGMRW